MEIVILILALAIILAIYYFLKDLMSSILLALTPTANFLNTEPINVFWIIIIVLVAWMVFAIARSSNKREARHAEYRQRAAGARKNVKLCPKCHNALVLKNGQYGQFWGCSRFPHCEYTEQVKIDPQKTNSTYVKPEFEYQVKPALNPQEKRFLRKLQTVTKDFYYIRSQVPYSNIFEKKVTNIDEVTNLKDKTIIFSPELSYVADFVLYDKETELPVATIEFNGLVHYEKETIEKDTRKKEICDKANLPYITFWTRNKEKTVYYPNTEQYIKERLIQFMPNFMQ